MSINVTIDGLDTEIDVSLVPSATEINPESYVALRGLKGDKGDDGVVGRDGTDGQDGVGITSITQNLDGTLSINLDDGTSYVTEPLKGADGQDGRDGEDGYTPVKGVDYFDGTNGRDGVDGYTPVKGVDYFDGEKGDTGDTGATGATGNGIASAVLNADYTLTLSFTDGTSYTTPSIRGEKGEQGDAGEVDTAMSESSALPVQNKVIKAYVDGGLSTKADASSLATVATSGSYSDLSNKPSIPTKTSDLANDSGFIDSSALPAKVSDLTNDSGYITGYTETDPTVPSWAKASSKPSYMASEITGLVDFFYPVGSYYETSDTTFDPNASWGGTWSLETEGLVHIGAGSNYTAGSTGGSKDAIVPYHNHSVDAFTSGTPSTNTSGGMSANSKHSHTASNLWGTHTSATLANGGYYGAQIVTRTTSEKDLSHTHSLQNHTHSIGAHNTNYVGTSGNEVDANMPPYVVVNRWHRTA